MVNTKKLLPKGRNHFPVWLATQASIDAHNHYAGNTSVLNTEPLVDEPKRLDVWEMKSLLYPPGKHYLHPVEPREPLSKAALGELCDEHVQQYKSIYSSKGQSPEEFYDNISAVQAKQLYISVVEENTKKMDELGYYNYISDSHLILDTYETYNEQFSGSYKPKELFDDIEYCYKYTADNIDNLDLFETDRIMINMYFAAHPKKSAPRLPVDGTTQEYFDIYRKMVVHDAILRTDLELEKLKNLLGKQADEPFPDNHFDMRTNTYLGPEKQQDLVIINDQRLKNFNARISLDNATHKNFYKTKDFIKNSTHEKLNKQLYSHEARRFAQACREAGLRLNSHWSGWFKYSVSSPKATPAVENNGSYKYSANCQADAQPDAQADAQPVGQPVGQAMPSVARRIVRVISEFYPGTQPGMLEDFYHWLLAHSHIIGLVVLTLMLMRYREQIKLLALKLLHACKKIHRSLLNWWRKK